MRYLIVVVSLMLIMTAAFANAEFYKYKDEQGRLRFTDDLSEVPPAQREGLKAYETVEDHAPAEAQEDAKAEVPKKQTTYEPAVKEEEDGDRYSRFKALMDEKQVVDNELRDIMAQKQALEAEKDQVTTGEELKKYNAKVDQLNERIDAYEKRRQAYQEKIKAYNTESKNKP